jgi:hypothetical protein
LPDGEAILCEMGPQGPIRWSGVLLELFWYGHDGRQARHGGFPVELWRREPCGSILAVQRDRVLIGDMFSEVVEDSATYSAAFDAKVRSVGVWLQARSRRAQNLESGRFRAGFLCDPAAAPDRGVRLPRARIDDEVNDAEIYFAPTAPVISAEEWIARSKGVEVPSVEIPIPPSRDRGILQRIASVFQGGG